MDLLPFPLPGRFSIGSCLCRWGFQVVYTGATSLLPVCWAASVLVRGLGTGLRLGAGFCGLLSSGTMVERNCFRRWEFQVLLFFCAFFTIYISFVFLLFWLLVSSNCNPSFPKCVVCLCCILGLHVVAWGHRCLLLLFCSSCLFSKFDLWVIFTLLITEWMAWFTFLSMRDEWRRGCWAENCVVWSICWDTNSSMKLCVGTLSLTKNKNYSTINKKFHSKLSF